MGEANAEVGPALEHVLYTRAEGDDSRICLLVGREINFAKSSSRNRGLCWYQESPSHVGFEARLQLSITLRVVFDLIDILDRTIDLR